MLKVADRLVALVPSLLYLWFLLSGTFPAMLLSISAYGYPCAYTDQLERGAISVSHFLLGLLSTPGCRSSRDLSLSPFSDN